MNITNWKDNFENNRTKELKKLMWVPMPNKHDGDGYTELLDHKNGASHYGAWCALVQVASKCDPRGSLLRDSGKPHDSVTLERITRIPKSVWNEALPRLLSIGWIDTCEDVAEECEILAGDCLEGKGKKEEKERYVIIFDAFRKLYPGKKRGNETEFDNFKKKHSDWKAVLPDLKCIIECQIQVRQLAVDEKRRYPKAGIFVPNWKNLQTWINNRCWEEEIPSLPKPEGKKRSLDMDAISEEAFNRGLAEDGK